MKESEKTNWLKLYEAADKIKEIEPWKELWDSDLFIYIEDNNIDKAIYFCTMGKAGMHKSIAVFKGDQIAGYLELMEGNINDYLGMNYQECLKVNYLPKIDTIPKNIELIKKLGLKYKGTWTSFEKFENGYDFRELDLQDVPFMTKALEIYYNMYNEYVSKKMKIDFESGNAFIRKYNTKTNSYKDIVDAAIFPIKDYSTIEISDEYKKILSKLKKTDIELEMDFLNYLPVNIEDCKDKLGRHTLPLIYVLAEHNSQLILDMNLEKKPDNYEEYMHKTIERFIKTLEKIGKPKTIYVRDIKTEFALKKIAKEANIKLVLSRELPAIDFAYEMFINPPKDFPKF